MHDNSRKDYSHCQPVAISDDEDKGMDTEKRNLVISSNLTEEKKRMKSKEFQKHSKSI